MVYGSTLRHVAPLMVIGLIAPAILYLCLNLAHAAEPGATRPPETKSDTEEVYRSLDFFGEVIDKIRSEYVVRPDQQALIDSAVKGMLRSLDSDSSYIDAAALKRMQADYAGEFGGLGIEVAMKSGQLEVVSPLDDTPASRAGVLPGDRITHIDGVPVAGLELHDAVEKMRGPAQTTTMLTIERKGGASPETLKIIRETIRIRPVKSRSEGEIGYIRISTFNQNAHADFRKAMAHLRVSIGPALKGYVVDLRNNPGGVLDQAISVTDEFIDGGALLLIKGQKDKTARRMSAKPGDAAAGKKVAVLINGGSSSAAEIVAGALQDHGRAVVVGSRSMGRGSVQTIIPLGKKGALRLTTALYYTPSNRSIAGRGITPDVVVEQNATGAAIPAESRDDNQLQAALAHLRSEATPMVKAEPPKDTTATPTSERDEFEGLDRLE